MARDVADCALLLGIIAGPDGLDPTVVDRPVPDYAAALRSGVRGKRAVVVEEWVDPATTDPDVARSFEEALGVLARLGMTIDRVRWPRANDAATIFAILLHSDTSYLHRDWVRDRGADYGAHFRRRMLAASLMPSLAVQKAMRLRAVLRTEWRAHFTRWDVVLSPTASRPAETISHLGEVATLEQAERAFGFARIQRHAAPIGGTPGISVPCGFTPSGLPIGLQVMADAFHESTALAVAAAYEGVTEWHRRRPPLAVP